MTTDTMMTDTATNTSESQAASTATPATEPATQQAAPANAQTDATQQQANQQQTAEPGNTETAADNANQDKPAEKVGAPEKYEFKAAEGQKFDDAVLEQFSEVARELDLPQDAAQKVLDKMAPVLQARQAEAVEKMRTEWADTAKTDKEFGGEKLNENLSVAKKALDQFATPELRTLLNETGLGNHPEVIRMFYRAGKAISEDRFVGGSATTAGGSRDPAKALYPSQ